MITIRTLAFASFAFVSSAASAFASTGNASIYIPPVHVYSETASSSFMPGFDLFGLGGHSEEGAYTVYNKAPHNGFDLRGNGVHPDIGPITD